MFVQRGFVVMKSRFQVDSNVISLLVVLPNRIEIAEALHLIRLMDSEDAQVADLCKEIESFLDRITWLFHEDGCLHVPGHVAYILKWLEKPHFYIVDGVGKCIGGGGYPREALDYAFAIFRSWTVLVRSVLAAEFPSFDLMASFSVFGVVSQVALKGKVAWEGLIGPLEVKLARLSKSFGCPNFGTQFKDHLQYSIVAFRQSNGLLTPQRVWPQAVASTSSMKSNPHPSEELVHVFKRFVCFAPSTSAVEQSFSMIQRRLPSQRLNCDPHSESRTIGLLLASHTGDALTLLCESACAIWLRAFPTYTRTHANKRRDANTSHRRAWEDRPQVGLASESAFLKRYLDLTGKMARAGSAHKLATYQPEHWGQKLEKEKDFQQEKRGKRLIEAWVFNLTVSCLFNRFVLLSRVVLLCLFVTIVKTYTYL